MKMQDLLDWLLEIWDEDTETFTDNEALVEIMTEFLQRKQVKFDTSFLDEEDSDWVKPTGELSDDY